MAQWKKFDHLPISCVEFEGMWLLILELEEVAAVRMEWFSINFTHSTWRPCLEFTELRPDNDGLGQVYKLGCG